MAINSTRGLPSFSEMYAAFKNKGSLGDAINAGVEGYKTGDTMRRADLAQQSQSELEKQQAAKAKHDAETPKEQFIRLDQITDPKELATLEPQSQIQPETGLKVVPLSVYNSINKQRLNTETLELKAQMAQTQAQADAERAKAAQEKQALLNEIGPKAQAISAAKGLAEAASKVDAPSMAGRAGSFIKENAPTFLGGGTPTAAVLAERQGASSRKRLEELQGNAQGAILDNATGIQSDPLETKAIQILNKAGKPVTPDNIAEVKRRLGAK